MTFDDIRQIANRTIKDKHLSSEYSKRLELELKQIDIQGANDYWIELYTNQNKFVSNSNGLVLPFVLGITDIDPITHEWSYRMDINGKDDDIIVLETENGIIEIPAKVMVDTPNGPIKASELKVGENVNSY